MSRNSKLTTGHLNISFFAMVTMRRLKTPGMTHGSALFR